MLGFLIGLGIAFGGEGRVTTSTTKVYACDANGALGASQALEPGVVFDVVGPLKMVDNGASKSVQLLRVWGYRSTEPSVLEALVDVPNDGGHYACVFEPELRFHSKQLASGRNAFSTSLAVIPVRFRLTGDTLAEANAQVGLTLQYQRRVSTHGSLIVGGILGGSTADVDAEDGCAASVLRVEEPGDVGGVVQTTTVVERCRAARQVLVPALAAIVGTSYKGFSLGVALGVDLPSGSANDDWPTDRGRTWLGLVVSGKGLVTALTAGKKN